MRIREEGWDDGGQLCIGREGDQEGKQQGKVRT